MSDNAIHLIEPYEATPGVWVFDDEPRGLIREPFVAGVPAMIEELAKDIPEARAGFPLIFSASEFPGAEVLELVEEDMGGAWYRTRLNDKLFHGWLCPALLKYFELPPARIYISAGETNE